MMKKSFFASLAILSLVDSAFAMDDEEYSSDGSTVSVRREETDDGIIDEFRIGLSSGEGPTAFYPNDHVYGIHSKGYTDVAGCTKIDIEITPFGSAAPKVGKLYYRGGKTYSESSFFVLGDMQPVTLRGREVPEGMTRLYLRLDYSQEDAKTRPLDIFADVVVKPSI